MSVGWSALTFTPDDEAVAVLRSSWGWLLAEPFTPLLFSSLGDMFFESSSGRVYWLNTGTGQVSEVAESAAQFKEMLRTEIANDWFLPPLVEKLRAAGKVAGPGCCYTFATLPVFAEGKYEVSNLNPVPAKEHFSLTGHIHKEIQSLPNGARVKIDVVP